jgi:hypothetical protein
MRTLIATLILLGLQIDYTVDIMQDSGNACGHAHGYHHDSVMDLGDDSAVIRAHLEAQAGQACEADDAARLSGSAAFDDTA